MERRCTGKPTLEKGMKRSRLTGRRILLRREVPGWRRGVTSDTETLLVALRRGALLE
jgi:hypothetical protein